MLVVTTPTGRIGRHVVAQLVAAGEPVRVIVRDRTRLEPGMSANTEVVEGSIDDAATLGKALDGADAVFWCIPENSGMADVAEFYLGFSRPFAAALADSSVRRVVFVSSGGRGWAKDAGPISALHAVEELLERTGVHLRALRCGMFMENVLHQIEPLRRQGMFFYPLDGDIPVPLCATRDIGARAADLLRDRAWTGQAGTGVHGPVDLSLNEMAGVMSKLLGRPIRYQKVPEPAYKSTLVEHGQSEAFAQGLVDMFREIAGGIHAADPRTPESTTPTAFEAWCDDTLRPAIG